MAAEMSTAALAMLAIRSSKQDVSMLVTHLEASFGKKANARTTFQCDQGKEAFFCIQRAIDGTPQTLKMTTTGRLPDGQEVSQFHVTWSFKKRSQK